MSKFNYCKPILNNVSNMHHQGSLTEGEGSVWLTSLYQLA